MSEERKINVKGILKGILFSAIATVICMVILTLICYFGDISDKLLGILVFAAAVLCVFLGALLVAGNAQKSGLAHGALLGIGYFLIIFIISLILQRKVVYSTHLVTMLVGTVAGGMLGGILGVHTKN